MDVGERLFEILSNWRRRQREEVRAHGRFELKDCEKALALVVQPFFEEPVEIHESKQSGVSGGSFFLPAAIDFFQDPRKNRELYLHQILMLAGAQQLALCWPGALIKDEERAQYFLEKRDLITAAVSDVYPYFKDFQVGLHQEFDLAEKTPADHWLFWGGLSSGGNKSMTGAGERKNPARTKKNRDHDIETSFERDEVDLDKEQQNPVTHSFEKMETADEYQGGSRTADGSDQLEEHQAALKELKLNKVTRSGESAAAFLNSDFHGAGEGELDQLKAETSTPTVLYYPEWHYKKRNYLKNHCRLVLSTAEDGESEKDLRAKLSRDQAPLIERSKKQLQQICNQYKWRNQQLEGAEIDIDAFVRHLTDVRNRLPSSGRLYMNQIRRARDFQMLVLMDFSLSTDSYVDNRRVLDVEMEAVGLMGLLADEERDNTMVAGTFSETRHHCAFEFLKKSDEGWNAYFKRAPAVEPRGYTRLAPALRHGTELLSKSKAKSKILILLTDGKPTDYDGYEGRYGVEDIHKACLEASQQRILTKAFAIERNAKHYFPRMFPSFEILPAAEMLPQSLVKTLLEARTY